MVINKTREERDPGAVNHVLLTVHSLIELFVLLFLLSCLLPQITWFGQQNQTNRCCLMLHSRTTATAIKAGRTQIRMEQQDPESFSYFFVLFLLAWIALYSIRLAWVVGILRVDVPVARAYGGSDRGLILKQCWCGAGRLHLLLLVFWF